jgi:resuscitation-promoting factor RpfB
MKRLWRHFGKLSSNAKVAMVLVVLLAGWGASSAASGNTINLQEDGQAQTCKASTKVQNQTQPVPFSKTQVNDSTLDQGKTAITTPGVNGEKTITNKITSYAPDDCKPTTTQEVSESVTKQPVAEVTSIGTKAPAPTPAPAPAPAPKPAQTQSPSCSPYYSPCVPNVSYDLDCKDIGMRVTVHGGDPYHLDADHDGIGCESY